MNNKFFLKPLTFDNLKTIFEWRNSERIKSLMYTNHNITWEEHIRWFHKVNKSSSDLVWVLYDVNSPLGLVSFSDINKEHSRCFWGFYIGEEKAPKGAGTIMGVLALDKIFQESGMNKVCAEVIDSNSGSIRYHKKLGFEQEGVLAQHVWKDNQFKDVIRMALFNDKWQKVRTGLVNIQERGN
ncbi:hypothetical protein GCM10007216_02160 [Thalassobacillus devorans]|uniref:N-acetyltransferase domain-containing protein n=1 Tax=Thalassobacillus devorans TaxID=279813 RepID=A0ABQ1NEY8_9BACI|nr:UDP-4-amino-4,6-dideoxy-N-acetyl-beta-L-altrosamine N-acetyltransferase [Thalassobacillus devorans]NIK27124.1 UDP-4-amino-4,6-dideoxy-N-acetyl-beta-L-altrosamine N-acetyltransferase [Thalassobacillus devorans]GGC75134.1 hypothetical protein GCM10007216_02160 [Thalassobacillus devorans]